MKRPLRVVIDASFPGDGSQGGIQQLLIGLVHGLTSLSDGAEEYIIVVDGEGDDWLGPYAGPHCRLVPLPRRPKHWRQKAKEILGPLALPASRLYRTAKRAFSPPPAPVVYRLEPIDAFFTSLKPDVLHIPYPPHFRSFAGPTVYSIHDLQHRHYPEFFGAETLKWIEAAYSEAFARATSITTISDWARQDVIRQYGVAPEKIVTAHLGPPTGVYRKPSPQTLEQIRKTYRLPKRFMLFPGVTYAHKNHERLLEAVHRLHQQGMTDCTVICTGSRHHHWPQIERTWKQLGLQSAVRWTGFVPAEDLRCLYHLASFVLFPSLFEGAGFPVLEALHTGAPLACSDIPAHREYAGEAALYFDPLSVEAIADAAARMFREDELRAALRRKGAKQVARFTWEAYADTHREHYRRAAGLRDSGASGNAA